VRLLGRIIVNLLSVGFLFAILGAITVAGAFWYFGRDLPDEQKLAAYEPPIVSRVYANDGRLIGEFASEKRVFVPIDRVPKRVIHAFIAAEDQRFYSHTGVDPFGNKTGGGGMASPGSPGAKSSGMPPSKGGTVMIN